MMIVTGPSFTRETAISAPNSPVSTCVIPRCLSPSLNASYKGIAVSGRAAAIKLGRLPFLCLQKSKLRNTQQRSFDIFNA